MKLSIVIVNYNSEKFLEKALSAIYSEHYSFDFETIVVDNNSSDGSLKMLKSKFPSVKVIKNVCNVGFARANNQAIPRAKAEYILFLNPDAVPEKNAIEKLVNFIEQNKYVGCVGGKLLNQDGTIQYSCRSFPDYISIFFGRQSIFRRLFPENLFSKKFLLTDIDYTQSHKIDWIMGACMLTKRETLHRVGVFDESFFLFVEDMDLCYRLKKYGYEIYYCPDAVFYHTHGAITKRFWLKSLVAHNVGIYRFFNKNYGFNIVARSIAATGVVFRIFYLVAFHIVSQEFKRQKV